MNSFRWPVFILSLPQLTDCFNLFKSLWTVLGSSLVQNKLQSITLHASAFGFVSYTFILEVVSHVWQSVHLLKIQETWTHPRCTWFINIPHFLLRFWWTFVFSHIVLCTIEWNKSTLSLEGKWKAWSLLAAGQKVYLPLSFYHQCHEFRNGLALVVPGPA